uniref:Uncharacterized protein n=1 Tax=Oryza brachyantha TaxID=4533 RepID=J3MF35_ORYBR
MEQGCKTELDGMITPGEGSFKQGREAMRAYACVGSSLRWIYRSSDASLRQYWLVPR